jgi:hypothetical protein
MHIYIQKKLGGIHLHFDVGQKKLPTKMWVIINVEKAPVANLFR